MNGCSSASIRFQHGHVGQSDAKRRFGDCSLGLPLLPIISLFIEVLIKGAD